MEKGSPAGGTAWSPAGRTEGMLGGGERKEEWEEDRLPQKKKQKGLPHINWKMKSPRKKKRRWDSGGTNIKNHKKGRKRKKGNQGRWKKFRRIKESNAGQTGKGKGERLEGGGHSPAARGGSSGNVAYLA